MKLLSVSINHGTAPFHVRERAAFSKKKQAEALRFITENIAEECVILSTCNRCEFYLVSRRDSREPLFAYLKSLADGFDFAPFAEVFTDKDAVNHLMSAAAGLLSMIIGEDQILGQVKDAHEFSAAHGASGIYLNTLFRLAVTGAKKVKTDTLLSKTPVSVATIAIKLCEEALGALDGKNALIIGASGKIGSIVFKDLRSLNRVNLLVTERTHSPVCESDFDGAKIIAYADRYDYLDGADIIISTTSSPHFTLTADKIRQSLRTQKDRIFIDLAVPKDIEEGGGYVCKNIDDLRRLSEINNKKKLLEAKKAEKMLEKYVNEFLVWQIFHENRPFLNSLKFGSEAEKNSFRRKLYDAKSSMNYVDFNKFIKDLKR